MNIFKRIYNFFKGTLEELKKVDWISRTKTAKYTLLVILCLVFGVLFILVLDQIFAQVKALIL